MRTMPLVRVMMWDGQGEIPGGHRIQMVKTIEALRRIGVEVVHDVSDVPDVDRVDVLHMFGGNREVIRRARIRRVPVVISTIHWSVDYVLNGPDASRRKQLERAARFGYSVLRRGPGATATTVSKMIWPQLMAYESVDLMLPNSRQEADTIYRELGVTTPFHVVPNAVDHHLFTLPPDGTPRHGVLYAARFDPHKNQLGLIQALKGTGTPLTLVGEQHPHHPGYRDECRRAAGQEVTFLSGRQQGDLAKFYQSAEVHVMPSWFETTGLVSLEAALSGAAVVTTSRGYASEYFGTDAFYCDPARPESIRSAVAEARERGGSAALRQRIIDRYTWDHAARATLEGYQRAVGSWGSG